MAFQNVNIKVPTPILAQQMQQSADVYSALTRGVPPGAFSSSLGGQLLMPYMSRSVPGLPYPGVAPTALSTMHPYLPQHLAMLYKYHPRLQFVHEEPKPQQSYIGLISLAILSSPDKKLVLSDIYQWLLDNYSYFRQRGPGWRNSIRHNLSLNDCFIKAGRSANGKGHYWAIHPANVDDFQKGDFRRRRAQRKVRRAMGLSVPDEEDDSPSPPPVTSQPTWQQSPEHPGCVPTHNPMPKEIPSSPIACDIDISETKQNELDNHGTQRDVIPDKHDHIPHQSFGKKNSPVMNDVIVPAPTSGKIKRAFDIDNLLATKTQNKRPKVECVPNTSNEFTQSTSTTTVTQRDPKHSYPNLQFLQSQHYELLQSQASSYLATSCSSHPLLNPLSQLSVVAESQTANPVESDHEDNEEVFCDTPVSPTMN
ncbi:unnamed protein product [Owenia fusiformis]|uniref:Uncharacterized protein n=1 Tax=Owenia fusiformis TaxID=6347 RepID=A0A8J1U019_OWEFU|nr:unnamed protein product [Owenia fusiformis]